MRTRLSLAPPIRVGSSLLVAAALLVACRSPREIMFGITGEETLLAQVRGIAQWALGGLRPFPSTVPEAAVAYTDLAPFGVNTFLDQEVESDKRERSVEMIADAGFAWIRQSFPWYDIEIHGKGDFEDRRHEPHRSAWDKYDMIVDLAAAYDIDIIARLEAPPAWTRADGTERGAFAPPDDQDDYADYAAAVVDRYRGRIRFYQIWNEPNIHPEWGHQPVDPEGYTELLCAAYTRVKATDPDAVVISGAMAQTSELGTWNADYQGNNLMDTVFLQRMYNAGAGDCFDIMAVNDYMLWSGPTDHRNTLRDINFSRPMWVRDVMVANGDAAKPIWLSEMNSNAAPQSVPDRFGRVTLDQQARWAPLAYDRVQREWPWAGVTTVWFFKRASDHEVDQPFYYFRLVEPDFTPLPVYDALSNYLNGLEPTLYQGVHQETAWQIGYTGPWETVDDDDASLNAYTCSSSDGAALTVRWEGRRLELVPGPEVGRVQLTDETGATRIITLDGAPVALASGLVSKPRTVTLRPLDGALTVDEFIVR